MKRSGTSLIKKDPSRYSPILYGEGFLANFHMVCDYGKNAPFMERKRDEKTPSWQKKIFIVECLAEDIHELQTRLEHAHKIGLLKYYFGEVVWFYRIPGDGAVEGEKHSGGR